jgi:predicted transcriptional regulator
LIAIEYIIDSGDEGAETQSMTVTRTLRLDDDVDKALEKLAEEEGESVNVLANKALRRLVEWDVRAEKMGLVSIERDALIRMMEPFTLEQAKELGRLSGRETWVPMMLYLYGNVSVDSVLKSRDVIDRYMLRFSSEYTFRDGKYHVTLRHSMGVKWSAFYAGAIEDVLPKMLGMDVVTTLTEDACFFEFGPAGGTAPTEGTGAEQH